MDTSTSRPAKLILANTVNELMLATPILSHATPLFASAPRKLWLAEAGDLVVLPYRPSAAFVRYACELRGVDPGSVHLATTTGAPTALLARDILATDRLLDDLRRFCRARRDVELLCYALDAPTVDLARTLAILPMGFAAPPAKETAQTVYSLNSKSGFRRVASQLGLAIAEGSACTGADALHASVGALLETHPQVRVKLDRSSNAYGQVTLAAADGPDVVARAIERQLAVCSDQPADFVVECAVDVAASPSIEMTVGEGSVATSYFCLQRYRGGHFSGMVADPSELAPKLAATMTAAGAQVGRHLHDRGYRGVFDLDAVVTRHGELYFTETNVRRTAGTFIHELVSRLVGPHYAGDRVWIADCLAAGALTHFAAGEELVRRNGLAYDAASRRGVIITSDSVERDGIWRYLIIDEDRVEAEAIEATLIGLLSDKQPRPMEQERKGSELERGHDE